ncbi:MAG: peptidoglycan-binding protein [Candidatus Gracilibacteria bacterium]
MRSHFRTLAHIVTVSFFFTISFNGMVALAQELPPAELTDPSSPVNPDTVPAPVVQNPKARTLVGTRVFETTAYYSPLPNQQKYVTGSYASDIRLNGRGTNGADGTPVYPGMVAAPSVYPFGTKMRIPGIGTVAVHDRGGAIVASQDSTHHDRLDIWMGFGDKGLSRALTWGRRTVSIELLGINPSIEEEITLSNYDPSERVPNQNPNPNPPSTNNTPSTTNKAVVKTSPVVIAPPALFEEDIWYLSSGASVVKLQRVLQALGYYKGVIDGFYGDDVRDAVFAFQKDHSLFGQREELGAGHTGPQTRIALEKAFTDRRKTLIPTKSFGRGSHGEDVLKLQQVLKSLGYDVPLTGVFDEKTESALFQFQKDQSIVLRETDLGAGYFGQKTLSALEKKYVASLTSQQAAVVIDVPSYLVQDLAPNSSGESVRQLQQELMRLNYVRVQPTGFYGPATAHAVFKFKQAQGIVASEQDDSAQLFEVTARTRMNTIIASRFHIIKTIAIVNAKGSKVASEPSTTAKNSLTVATK